MKKQADAWHKVIIIMHISLGGGAYRVKLSLDTQSSRIDRFGRGRCNNDLLPLLSIGATPLGTCTTRFVDCVNNKFGATLDSRRFCGVKCSTSQQQNLHLEGSVKTRRQ